MKIIIVGCGKVGTALTAQLSREDNNVTVIDTDYDVIRNVSNMYDVMGIAGNGASYSVLQEADIEHADLMIAVTKSDEMNLLCCVIAKQAADCHTIARVRNPIYREERDFIRRKLGLSMIINPEHAAAMEIARLLRFPSAIEIDSFSRGRVEMMRFKVPQNSRLAGFALKDLSGAMQSDILVCAAERNDEVYIPDGNFIIREGDSLSIIATPQNAVDFFRRIGVRINQVRSTMIVGGGDITYYLAKSLESTGVDVKIIEKNRNRAEALSELLPKATIIYGDGSDRELLREECIQDMDSFVACTDMDEENIILSLYAKNMVSSKVVTKINHLEFNDVIHSLNLDSLIYPKHITAEYILQYVRAMKNSIGSNVETLYKLMDDRVEALEFQIHQNCRLVGIRLQDMKTRPNLLVAAISRQGKVIIPGGQDCFEVGDSVIVVTTVNGLQDIHEILSE
ncbi:MAG: Trk system potassium transporter TrkA [Fusicatenibacter sp.]|nr:Trk system potassium transporter TrkA [Lachnospiraceae bacterium]MDY2937586.1 Trk system potassium transporter TrkA [Fusicatenibacter sp.]